MRGIMKSIFENKIKNGKPLNNSDETQGEENTIMADETNNIENNEQVIEEQENQAENNLEETASNNAEIEKLVENTAETVDIVFVVKLPRGEGKKLDSRRKLYKILAKTDSKEFPTLRTYQTAELTARIKEIAKLKDVSPDNDACLALIEQIGNNLREFDSELERLKLLAGNPHMIWKEDCIIL